MTWGTTTWVESMEHHLGGNGGSTCFTLARLGVPVRLVAMLGADAFGEMLVSELQGVGVDTRFIARSAAPTPASIALVNSKGERLFLHRPGSSSEAFAEPIDFEAHRREAPGLSHYHLANYCALPRLRPQAADFLRRA